MSGPSKLIDVTMEMKIEAKMKLREDRENIMVSKTVHGQLGTENILEPLVLLALALIYQIFLS